MHILSLPPLEYLQAVVAAATLGSFSAAAKRLGITHGAVSRRIAAVEHWAGRPLFMRHGRGVRPTLEGEQLVARIETAITMLEDGRPSRRGEGELPVIRVGVVASFARLWLIPNLPFLEGTPADLRVEPDVDDRLMTLSDARMAIRLGKGDWPGVVAEPLVTETLYPVAAPSLAGALGCSPSPERLLEHPLLHDASTIGWRHWLTGLSVDYALRPQDRILQGHDLALLAAAAGLGISLVRDPYGLAFSRSLGLVPVHEQRAVNPNRFHVVTRPGQRHPAMQRLITRFHQLFTPAPTVPEHSPV